MKTVHEIAEIAGISKRTLHYYDEIGLLVPSDNTLTGYRIYNEYDLDKLQQILFFKEMGFSLKRINEIISNPDFNKADTFKKHLKLLEVKKERLEKLIDLVNKTLKGKEKMSFKEFDMTEINKLQEKYRKETEEKLGNTDAYKESMLKTSRYSNSDWLKINKEADLIYRSLVKYMHNPPDRKEVQKLISDWRMHITKYYYYCTVEIFSDLGKAYISDKRFLKNINKYGKGLAEFMSQAIEFYVQNPQSDL